MVKDILPVDPESPRKQEVIASPSETKEVPRVPEQEPLVEAPGIVVEQPTESEATGEVGTEPVGEVLQEAQPVLQRKVSTVAPKQVDRLEEEIEDVLEEDLKELYASMPPDKQAVFRQKGEETRSKIRVLVSSAKVNAKKIFQLIRGWLKIVPGVNRFFLEQEAKIKTDKILIVTEEEKKRNERL